MVSTNFAFGDYEIPDTPETVSGRIFLATKDKIEGSKRYHKGRMIEQEVADIFIRRGIRFDTNVRLPSDYRTEDGIVIEYDKTADFVAVNSKGETLVVFCQHDFHNGGEQNSRVRQYLVYQPRIAQKQGYKYVAVVLKEPPWSDRSKYRPDYDFAKDMEWVTALADMNAWCGRNGF